MRVGVPALPPLEKLYLCRFDRPIVEVELKPVRDDDFVDGFAKQILVKFLQAHHFTADFAEPVATDILGIAIFPAYFAVAIPMLHQAVMPVDSCHAFHIVGSAFAADDFRRKTAWLDHSMRRRVELVICLDFLLHRLKSFSVDDGRVIVPDVITRQLSLVLDDFMRPMVFREIPLEYHISGIDRVLQGVADKGNGAGVAVFLEPKGSVSQGNVFQEVIVNSPNGYGFLLVDDEGLSVPTVAV